MHGSGGNSKIPVCTLETRLWMVAHAEIKRCEMMGMFVNLGNEAFAVALNSEIYDAEAHLNFCFTNPG